ncbi:MAG: glycosyl hydrolase, partial [Bacteroidota bacterium]
GVYRSDDAGWSWKKMNDERKLRQRAFYYSRIYADPLDPETVYCLNVNFYKSVDGGKTFDIDINVPHGDNHDLWIDPNNPQRMISSNDGGACVSTNGGKSWTEEDYPTSQLYHVTTTMDVPYHVAGAQQDNTTLSIPSDGWGFKHLNEGNKSWFYEVGGGESGYIAPHPTNPDLFYAGSQGALLTRYDRSNGQERDIQVYPRFFSGEPASSLPERWQWTYPIVFSPLDPSILYTCSQHVWKTTNDGQSWDKISPDLTFADPETLGPTGGLSTKDMNGPEIYATVFALAPSFHDIQTLWAGSDDGRIHITRNGGKSWLEITPKDLPKFSTVSIIEASKHDPGTAYVAAYRYQVDDRAPYVYKTTDYGKTWTKIIKGIKPQDFARSVREDHKKKGLLFLGTENGVYVSFDAGENWESLQLNLPVTPIRDLVIKNDDVVLGTHGRSFWILDDIAPLRELNANTAASTMHFFKPADPIRGIYNLNVQYYLNEKVDSVEVSILDSSGKLVQKFVGNQEVFKQDNSVPYWERDGNTKPTTAKGINSFSWNLRYAGATTFPGMIIWSGRPQVGPKAVPGKYKVSVKANGLE